MKSDNKALLITFLIIVIIKIILVSLIHTPTSFADEYVFSKVARSFYFDQDLKLHGVESNVHPPLYPIIISVSYIFQDMQIVYFLMKLINVILTTLIIIPAYFLLKEFLTKRQSLLISIMISIMPSNFLMPSYIMSENLFYSLVIFSFYFFYKYLTTEKVKYNILSSIFIGLSFLTKMSGIILFILPLINLIKKRKLKTLFKNTITSYVIIVLTIAPFIIHRIKVFGWSISSILGAYTREATSIIRESDYIYSFINWLILYPSYILLALAVVPLLIAIPLIRKSFYDEKLKNLLIPVSIISVMFVILGANSAAGTIIYKSPFPWFTERPIGRYIDAILPLILISSLVVIGKNEPIFNSKKFFKVSIIMSFILAFSAQLTIAPLFPLNNISLSYIGSFKYLIERLLFNQPSFNTSFRTPTFMIMTLLFLLVPISIYFILKKIKPNFRNITIFLSLFFIASTLLNFSIIYHISNNIWLQNEQNELGIWLNNQDPRISTILLDEKYEGKITKEQKAIYERFSDGPFASIIGFWLNDNIIVGDPEETDADFIITRSKLSLQLIKEKNGLYIYKT